MCSVGLSVPLAVDSCTIPVAASVDCEAWPMCLDDVVAAPDSALGDVSGPPTGPNLATVSPIPQVDGLNCAKANLSNKIYLS